MSYVMKHKRRKVRMRRVWREWVRPVLPVIAVLLVVRSAVADWNDVPTGSMKPTILEGDRIFVNKLAYDLKFPFTTWSLWAFGGPERGDIIVFYSPENGIRLVKRVVGVPGDTVELRNNRLYINGQAAEYDDLDSAALPGLRADDWRRSTLLIEDLTGRSHPIMLLPERAGASSWFSPVRLNDDQYFVMGDNRDNSADSRAFGLVPRKLIAGRATRVVLSVDPFAWTLRWGRLLKALK